MLWPARSPRSTSTAWTASPRFRSTCWATTGPPCSSRRRSTNTVGSTCSSTTLEVRIRVDGFLATSDEEFERALQMNFFTGLRATRAALGPMLEQGSGAIVNIASVNSFFQPDSSTIDYGVAKAAVVNLSKSLSQEFGPRGIRVNCVSPGQVGTDLWLGEHGVAATFAEASGADADTIRETAAAAIATGRFSTPDEVATLVTILASDRTANVTGVNYIIDGGLIKTT